MRHAVDAFSYVEFQEPVFGTGAGDLSRAEGVPLHSWRYCAQKRLRTIVLLSPLPPTKLTHAQFGSGGIFAYIIPQVQKLFCAANYVIERFRLPESS